jgi:purine-binding chemotaxis protein CheW
MEQPWPQTPEAAPEADDLPLAGLLAELLAASEAGSAAAGDGEPLNALAGPPSWPEPGAEAAVDAGEVLRSLDQASAATSGGAPDDLSGMLLARLIEDEGDAAASPEPAAAVDRAAETEEPVISASEAGPEESAPGWQDSAAALMARLTETEEDAPAGAGPAMPPAAEPSVAADEFGHPAQAVFEREEPEILVSGGAAAGETAMEPAGTLEEVQAGAGEDVPAAGGEGPLPVTSGTEWEAVAEAGWTAGPASAPVEAETGFEAEELAPGASAAWAAIPPEPCVEEAAGPAVAGQADAPESEAESGIEAEAARGGTVWSESAPEEAPELPVAAAAAAPAGPVAERAAAGLPSGAAAEEDEFELVDASHAELMVDRLLNAARSVIHGTPVSRPEEAEEELELTPAAAPAFDAPAATGREQSRSGPDMAVAEAGAERAADVAAAQEAPASSPAARSDSAAPEPAGQRRREERLPDASPIPPSVMLMALGLPERLRARLQSIGDVERILQSQSDLRTVADRGPRLLVFRAGGESYGLSMESVREVERLSRVTPVPGAPAFFRGLVNLRGEILPVLDLAALLGRKGQPSAQRMIVAQAGSGDPVVALMVEELNGLAPLRESEVKPPPKAGPLRGSLDHRGRSVLWLDSAAVFGAEALEKAAAASPEGRA